MWAFIWFAPVELHGSFFGFPRKHFPLCLAWTLNPTSSFYSYDKVLVPKCKSTVWAFFFPVAFWFLSCASNGNFAWDVGVFFLQGDFSCHVLGRQRAGINKRPRFHIDISPSSCSMRWVHLYFKCLVTLNCWHNVSVENVQAPIVQTYFMSGMFYLHCIFICCVSGLQLFFSVNHSTEFSKKKIKYATKCPLLSSHLRHSGCVAWSVYLSLHSVRSHIQVVCGSTLHIKYIRWTFFLMHFPFIITNKYMWKKETKTAK